MTLVLFALLASLAAGLLKFVALSRGADFMIILKWFLYYFILLLYYLFFIPPHHSATKNNF